MLCGAYIGMSEHFTYTFNRYTISKGYCSRKSVTGNMKGQVLFNAANVAISFK